MIAVLFQNSTKSVAESLAIDVATAFNNHIKIVSIASENKVAWGNDIDWDDLLIVVFDGEDFTDHGNDFIRNYREKRSGKGLVLPVAVRSSRSHPPKQCEDIKAFPLDPNTDEVRNRFVKRVGAMIGLRVQQRENSVFVSYRAVDGKIVAEQLAAHLKLLGYPVFLDEAKELDEETRILPGTPVQGQIDEALLKSSIMLLLDTPEASASKWVTHEVDTANAMLLPVLPLCFRESSDTKQGPRFLSLRQHQRWINLPLPVPASPTLSEIQLETITTQMETFLCDLIQRKCRVPFLVEQEFLARNFTWKVVDQKLIVGESVRGAGSRFATKVLSHCSIFDHLHESGMKAFSSFMVEVGHPNFSLYIYDGDLIPETQLNAFVKASGNKETIYILHHQELAALIESNFAMKAI